MCVIENSCSLFYRSATFEHVPKVFHCQPIWNVGCLMWITDCVRAALAQLFFVLFAFCFAVSPRTPKMRYCVSICNKNALEIITLCCMCFFSYFRVTHFAVSQQMKFINCDSNIELRTYEYAAARFIFVFMSQVCGNRQLAHTALLNGIILTSNWHISKHSSLLIHFLFCLFAGFQWESPNKSDPEWNRERKKWIALQKSKNART